MKTEVSHNHRTTLLEQLQDVPRVEMPADLDRLAFEKLDRQLAQRPQRRRAVLRTTYRTILSIAAMQIFVVAIAWTAVKHIYSTMSDENAAQLYTQMSDEQLNTHVSEAIDIFYAGLNESRDDVTAILDNMFQPREI